MLKTTEKRAQHRKANGNGNGINHLLTVAATVVPLCCCCPNTAKQLCSMPNNNDNNYDDDDDDDKIFNEEKSSDENYFNYYNCNQNWVIKLHKCLARTYFFFKFTQNKIYFTNYIRNMDNYSVVHASHCCIRTLCVCVCARARPPRSGHSFLRYGKINEKSAKNFPIIYKHRTRFNCPHTSLCFVQFVICFVFFLLHHKMQLHQMARFTLDICGDSCSDSVQKNDD